jgi:hypothetical protein
MNPMLRPCWEIKGCGREEGGRNADALGVCPAYPDHGHSCWIIAGTFCGGEVQGTYARKSGFCTICEVYKLYSTSFGRQKDEFEKEHRAEFDACRSFISHLSEAPPREDAA